MKKANLAKWTRLWLLVTTLIMPLMGIAESPNISVDPVVHEGRFVIFVLKNYEDRGFVCTFIQARAIIKNHQGKGEVITRRSIVAENIILPAGSREKQVEIVDKEFIKELENQFDQPRIVDVTVPNYSCEPNIQYVTADKKVFREHLKDGSLGPEMVRIPAGRFRMGDIQGGGYGDEQPVHWVSVNQFAMGRYEITVDEFRQFVNATGYKTDAEKGEGCYTYDGEWKKVKGANWHNSRLSQTDNHPVTCVSWNDAIAYTEWLSLQTGQTYRLPTEAEWEYAARAGSETKYWWGNEIGSNKTNCWKKQCEDNFEYTAPVGSFTANAFGLYNTAGNIWEWTCSEYEDRYKGKEQDCLGKNRAKSDSLFVLRGGSCGIGAGWARSSFRNWSTRAIRDGGGGFRLASTGKRKF